MDRSQNIIKGTLKLGAIYGAAVGANAVLGMVPFAGPALVAAYGPWIYTAATALAVSSGGLNDIATGAKQIVGSYKLSKAQANLNTQTDNLTQLAGSLMPTAKIRQEIFLVVRWGKVLTLSRSKG